MRLVTLRGASCVVSGAAAAVRNIVPRRRRLFGLGGCGAWADAVGRFGRVGSEETSLVAAVGFVPRWARASTSWCWSVASCVSAGRLLRARATGDRSWKTVSQSGARSRWANRWAGLRDRDARECRARGRGEVGGDPETSRPTTVCTRRGHRFAQPAQVKPATLDRPREVPGVRLSEEGQRGRLGPSETLAFALGLPPRVRLT